MNLKRLNGTSSHPSGKQIRPKRALSTQPQPAQNSRTAACSKGLASAFLMKIEKGSKAYRYNVEVRLQRDDNRVPEIDLTRAFGDGKQSQFNKMCFSLFTVARRQNTSFGLSGKNGEGLVYNNRCTLYTSKPIEQQFIEIRKDKFEQVVLDNIETAKTISCIVTITPNEKMHELRLDDFSKENENELCSFLNLLTSQQVINQQTYKSIKSGLFEMNNRKTVDYVELRNGVYKGVEIVKNNGDPKPALKLDFSVSPFFKEQTVLDACKSILHGLPKTKEDYSTVLKFLYGVEVQARHRRQFTMAIGRFSDEPIEKIYSCPNSDSTQTIPEYFIETYHVNVNGAFCGVSPRNRSGAVYPLDMLTILPDQAVKKEHTLRHISEALRAANVVGPTERLRRILYHLKQLAFFGHNDNPIMGAFGVQIDISSNDIQLVKTVAPKIGYGQVTQKAVERGRWNQYNTLFTGTGDAKCWVLFYQKFDGRGRPQVGLVRSFVEKLKEAACLKNVFLQKGPDRVFEIEEMKTEMEWRKHFTVMCERKIDFMLFVDTKNNRTTHDLLKYYEARMKVLTQHVTLETIDNAINRADKPQNRNIVENIVMKTNAKFFGLNFVPKSLSLPDNLALDANNVLVIGIDLAFSSTVFYSDKATIYPPAIVGITSNIAANSAAKICGDFFYQQSRKDIVDGSSLKLKAKWIIETVKRNRPSNPLPTYVIVLRDGVCRGQYEAVKDEELGAIRAGFQLADKNYHPQVALIVGTKRHLDRSFKSCVDGVVQNPEAGTVADMKFRSNNYVELLLQSQTAIEGTAKPLKLTLVVNEMNLSAQQMNDFVNSLCHAHQVCTATTTLPEPQFQAHELAKRGLNVYNTMVRVDPGDIPLKEVPVKEGSDRIKKVVDCNTLNKILSYAGSRLESARFTA